MQRTIITTTNAPPAIGPYSQAVRIGPFVFTAGTLGVHPTTGRLADGIEGQVKQVMQNLEAVLESAGTGFGYVVKTTIFLADLGDFALVNELYGSYFPANPPARSTIQVARLPLGARVEIEAVAFVPEAGSVTDFQ